MLIRSYSSGRPTLLTLEGEKRSEAKISLGFLTRGENDGEDGGLGHGNTEQRDEYALHVLPPMVEPLRWAHAVVSPLVLLDGLLEGFRLPLVLFLPRDFRVLNKLIYRVLHGGDFRIDLEKPVDEMVLGRRSGRFRRLEDEGRGGGS